MPIVLPPDDDEAVTAVFTLTGDLGALLGSSTDRSVYVQSLVGNIVDTDSGAQYPFPDRTMTAKGLVSLTLPADAPTNLPHSSSSVLIWYRITIGRQTWDVPAQAPDSVHDLSEFATPYVGPPITASVVSQAQAAATAAAASAAAAAAVGTTTDSLIAGRIAAAGSATQGAGDSRWEQVGHRPVNILSYLTATGDQTAHVQAAVDATPTGGVLEIPTGVQIRVDGQINLNKAMTLFSPGRGGLISGVSGTTAQKLLNITASDVLVRGVKLQGPQYASAADQYAIYVAGASAGSPLARVGIVDCELNTWGFHGVYALYVNDFVFNQNLVRNIGYAGIGVLSCQRGSISSNRISNVLGNLGGGVTDAYGIFMSRKYGTLAAEPRSAYITVAQNVITDVPTWAGIDSHAGQSLVIQGNLVVNCEKPISMVSSKDAGGTYVFACRDVALVGNIADSTVTDGSRNSMHIIGNATESATGLVADNTIIGHGIQSALRSGGLQFEYTYGLVVKGNRLTQPSPAGITFNSNNVHFVCTGNTIVDIWSQTGTAKAVQLYDGGNNDGVLDGNTLLVAGKAATYIASNGIGLFVPDVAGNAVRVGQNLFSSVAGTALSDPGSRTDTSMGL